MIRPRSSRSASAAVRRPVAGAHRRSLGAGVLVALLLLAAGCGGGAKNEPRQGEARSGLDEGGRGAIGEAAPAFALPDLEGKTVSSAEFAGKVVIVDFWATWCPPCREEMPHFVRLQAKYRAQGLAIVGISLDMGNDAGVAEFAEEHDLNFPVLLGNETVAKVYDDVTFLPTTFVIDRQGTVVKKFVGMAAPDAIESVIAPLLGTTS